MSRGWRLALPLGFLIAIHLACLFGGFLAPNSALEQNRDLPWAPPTKLRFVDTEGRFHWRPFVYPLVEDPHATTSYREDRNRLRPLQFFYRGDSYRLGGTTPMNVHLLGVAPPAKLLFLGTDGLGRDVFAQLLVGGRVSLFAGLLAASVALAIGTGLGGAAGFLGGKIDAFLMRVVELFLTLPWLYLLLALRAFLPLHLDPLPSFLLIVAVIGLIGWAHPARLIRGVVLSASRRPFVTAARSTGIAGPQLLRSHVLPHALPAIATQAAILIPSYVLAEVTLSFLGLGIADAAPSWGRLLTALQSFHVLARHKWMAATAAPLLATFLAYYSLGRQTRSFSSQPANPKTEL